MSYLISPILWILATISWAAASVLLFRFGTSIFRNLNKMFWNPIYSSQNAKTIGGYKIDAFHLFQSAAICFATGALVFYEKMFGRLIDFCIFGGIEIIVFPIFYGLISRHNKK